MKQSLKKKEKQRAQIPPFEIILTRMMFQFGLYDNKVMREFAMKTIEKLK